MVFANGDVPLCNVDYNNKFPTGNIIKIQSKNYGNQKSFTRRELHLKIKKISQYVKIVMWDEATGEELISAEYEKVSISNNIIKE